MTFQSLLLDTFTLKTVARTSDSAGRWTEVWSGTNTFKGRLCPLKIEERLGMDRQTIYGDFKIFAEYNAVTAAIVEEDRVVMGGATYQVRSIRNPSNMNRHLEIIVLEIK